MIDRSGQRIDSYNLVRLLGQGNLGDVYLGENIYRKTQVAIKLLHLRLTNEEIPNFLNEARIFRLKHPHIVPILDFGIEPTTSTPLATRLLHRTDQEYVGLSLYCKRVL